MSSLSITVDGNDQRRSFRRHVEVPGTVATIHGSSAVLVRDLCRHGARLLGRRLPPRGKEILLRWNDRVMLGRITWAKNDHRGVAFEEDDLPTSAGPSASQPS